VAKFEVISRQFPAATKVNDDSVSQDNLCPGPDSNRELFCFRHSDKMLVGVLLYRKCAVATPREPGYHNQ
jgi:hypothetical protein